MVLMVEMDQDAPMAVPITRSENDRVAMHKVCIK